MRNGVYCCCVIDETKYIVDILCTVITLLIYMKNVLPKLIQLV